MSLVNELDPEAYCVSCNSRRPSHKCLMLVNREVSGEKVRKGSAGAVTSPERQNIPFTFVMLEICVPNDIPKLGSFTLYATDLKVMYLASL